MVNVLKLVSPRTDVIVAVRVARYFQKYPLFVSLEPTWALGGFITASHGPEPLGAARSCPQRPAADRSGPQSSFQMVVRSVPHSYFLLPINTHCTIYHFILYLLGRSSRTGRQGSCPEPQLFKIFIIFLYLASNKHWPPSSITKFCKILSLHDILRPLRMRMFHLTGILCNYGL